MTPLALVTTTFLAGFTFACLFFGVLLVVLGIYAFIRDEQIVAIFAPMIGLASIGAGLSLGHYLFF